ncbi:MAG: SDR family oxidoreductase [Candidatus Latescibacteria bacterium]|nr:SDR family oxidoreductase [Candidatus Latescibacterota bacterium]
MKLKDRVGVVTGGGRGIGKAAALALAREGAKVVIGATTTTEIEDVANEIERANGRALAVSVDVTQKMAVENLTKRTIDEFGQIDILVNNAGVAIHNPIAKITEADWDLNIAVNLKGTFLCTQAVFQHMCDRGTGHIVNVSSISGNNGHANGGAYCAAKFGAVGFTEVTAVEGKPFGVKASVICPGPTDTRMRRENHPDDVLEELTLPEDIADAIVFVVTQPKTAHTLEMIVRTPLM